LIATAENIKTYRLDQAPEWLPGELKKQLADEGRLVLRGRFNVDGYIGESTRKELDYARRHEIHIRFLEDPTK